MPDAGSTASDVRCVELTLSAGGFELHADRWNGGSRARVLLLHGLGGNSVTWHGVAPRLARALQADVLAPDLPGFGRSRTGGRRVDIDGLVRLLEDILAGEAPNGEPWLVAGNSLGAVLALGLACRVPERVRGVSIAAPALPLYWGRGLLGIAALWSWVPASLPLVGRRLVAGYMLKTGVPGVVDEPIAALFGDPRRLDAALRDQLLAVSSYRLGWAREAARAYEEVTLGLGLRLLWPGGAERWVRRARCPVQVIRGGRDPIFPRAALEKLARVRPDWEHVELSEIGHVPQLEAPHDVAAHLVAWASRLLPA